MGYWTKIAAKVPVDRNSHPWAEILRGTLQRVNPTMFAKLTQLGELDAYLAVQVDDALRAKANAMARGMDENTAADLALRDMLPSDPEDDSDKVEDYEIEGAQADEAAMMEKYLEDNPHV